MSASSVVVLFSLFYLTHNSFFPKVFPQAEWEYETALQLKAGERNDDTNALLRIVMGDGGDDEGEGNQLDNMSDGTDDEELDGHFDLDAFHEERRRQYEELEEAGEVSDDSCLLYTSPSPRD